jgi:hypothetical protein
VIKVGVAGSHLKQPAGPVVDDPEAVKVKSNLTYPGAHV